VLWQLVTLARELSAYVLIYGNKWPIFCSSVTLNNTLDYRANTLLSDYNGLSDYRANRLGLGFRVRVGVRVMGPIAR